MNGGETASDPSGWNVDTLQRHIVDLIAEVDRRYEQRFEAQQEAMKAAFVASQAVLAEMDRRYAQRFEAQERAVTLALDRVDKEFHEHLRAAREETQAALHAADKAITKSETAAEKRFESVNEFRAQLSDQASTFIPRKEAENRVDQNTEKIDALAKKESEDVALINSRLDTQAGKGMGQGATVGYIFAASAFIGGLISIILQLAR